MKERIAILIVCCVGVGWHIWASANAPASEGLTNAGVAALWGACTGASVVRVVWQLARNRKVRALQSKKGTSA